MKISFPGGKQISAAYKEFTINTDQSVESGGNGQYPNPFELFKASLGTCMGYYVMKFCLEQDIPLDSIWLDIKFDEEDVIDKVITKIVVDKKFPNKYLEDVVKATEDCKIKKQLKHPPTYIVKTENYREKGETDRNDDNE